MLPNAPCAVRPVAYVANRADVGSAAPPCPQQSIRHHRSAAAGSVRCALPRRQTGDLLSNEGIKSSCHLSKARRRRPCSAVNKGRCALHVHIGGSWNV